MAQFFPRTLYGGHGHGHSDGGFTPLFRLLEDFDRYSANHRTGPGGRAAASHIPTFQPKFDVRETQAAYELHGELAGISRENVHIEFTDPQTLLVRGRVERTYTAGTPPAGLLEGDKPAERITESGEGGDEQQERPSSPQSHHAKVQDESEAAAEENGSGVAPTPAEPANKPADSAKYWVSERSIGEFSRTFTFPSRIEQDGVNATLKDGILTVVVPKAKKHEARRIEVS